MTKGRSVFLLRIGTRRQRLDELNDCANLLFIKHVFEARHALCAGANHFFQQPFVTTESPMDRRGP